MPNETCYCHSHFIKAFASTLHVNIYEDGCVEKLDRVVNDVISYKRILFNFINISQHPFFGFIKVRDKFLSLG